MSKTPDPLNSRRLTRASLIGIVLAAGGIFLFLVVWFGLGNTGIDRVPRLVLSVCTPPALIALVAGVYFLVIQPSNKS